MNEDKLKRLKEIIEIEATVPNKVDFMLTHVPFKNLIYGEKKIITEEEVYSEILSKSFDEEKDEHQFILIQGDNGSGKSHLIRWLKEKYLVDSDEEKEATIFISRAHNTLQDALEQVLNSPVFPEEIKNNELKKIKEAKQNITGEELKKTINFNFTMEIEKDVNSDNEVLDRRIREMLCEYLDNKFIQNNFLMIKGGPLDKVRSKIENTGSNEVNHDSDGMFSVKDFDITFDQIGKSLKKRDERASDHVINLAERLVNKRRGEQLKTNIVDYLNSKVSNVIQKSMKLETADFKNLFMELRKSLKKKNIKLTLFIEDINAFTGIDNALMEVLIANHKAEGYEDYCRICSVVGSTTDFYNKRLNDSIKDRITTNIKISEENFLGNSKKLSKFVAKYINAINISEDSVKEWVADGMKEENVPIAKVEYSFASTEYYDNKIMSLFPFTENALWNLYENMHVTDKSPRLILRDLVKPILEHWYKEPEYFLNDKNNFTNNSVKIPNWKSYDDTKANEDIDKKSADRRSILLRIWGNKTALCENGFCGGLTKEVFDAFNVFSGLSNIKPTVPVGPVEPVKPVGPVKPVEPDVVMPIVDDAKVKMAQKAMDEVINWVENDGKLKNHVFLKNAVRDLILSAINWNYEGIPKLLVKKYVMPINRISIEGTSKKDELKGSGLLLERNTETAVLFSALANWYYIGGQTWDFSRGEDDFITAISWVEKHKAEILKMAEPEGLNIEDVYFKNIAVLYGINSVFTEIDTNKASLEIASELLVNRIEFKKDENRGAEWDNLQNKLLRNTNYEKDVYDNALDLFRKRIGYGYNTSSEAKYVFADTSLIIKQINRLKKLNWNLNDIEFKIEDNSVSLIKDYSNIISKILLSLKDALIEEQNKARNHKKIFDDVLGENFTKEYAYETIMEMRRFVRFLNDDMNNSVPRDYYDKLNALTGTRLKQAIENIEKIINAKEFNSVEILSLNLLEEVGDYTEFLADFNKLVNAKKEIFEERTDTKSLNDFNNTKELLIKDVDDCITKIDSIGGGIK